jgi:hypothetical protein
MKNPHPIYPGTKSKRAITQMVKAFLAFCGRFRLHSENSFQAQVARADWAEARGRTLTAEVAKVENELAPLVREVVARMVKTEWKRHRPNQGQRFCLVMEFDEWLIHDTLLHGNSMGAIDMIGREIGYRAAREIRQINFARYVDEPEQRGYRVPKPAGPYTDDLGDVTASPMS